MDEMYLHNRKTGKNICNYDNNKTYEQLLEEAGIAVGETMVDEDGVPFTLDDLCIQFVHCDFI